MRRFIVGGLTTVVALTACDQIAGIQDARTGWTGSTGTSTGTGTGTSSGTTAPSFTFAITDASVNVPYGGINYVNVEIMPSGGFDSAVSVAVQGGPAGLVTMPLNIPASGITGAFQVSASGTLTLGQTFKLTLAATSGSITQTATVPAVVTGKPGDFDMTFGSAGVVMGPTCTGTDCLVNLNDIREFSPGTFVVGGLQTGIGGAGGNAIGLRYLSSGMPDTSFNMTGNVSNSYCSCTPGQGGNVSVAQETAGTLLFIGWGQTSFTATQDIFLFRYNSDGTMNVDGSDTGTEDVSLGANDNEQVTAAALIPNGANNVIVAGMMNSAQLFVARIQDRHTFGQPDTTFAAPNGWIAPPIGGTSSTAGALAFDAGGNIIVAGTVTTAATGADVVLLRLTPNGALDKSFGSGGIVNLPRSGDQHGSAVLVQPDGNIVVAADSSEGGSGHLLVQRFLPSGAPDASFGNAGAVLAPLDVKPPSQGAWMSRMLDGRLIVAGNGTVNASTGIVLARFSPNGTPDPTYGTSGEVVCNVAKGATVGAMTLTSENMLLLAGSISVNPGASFIARLWN
jgi:uncharacterized delta-60 repeat protein